MSGKGANWKEKVKLQDSVLIHGLEVRVDQGKQTMGHAQAEDW